MQFLKERTGTMPSYIVWHGVIKHTCFGKNSAASRRVKSPMSDADRVRSLKSRLSSIRAKSNLGPNGKPNLRKV
jgi:hypothetical protein